MSKFFLKILAVLLLLTPQSQSSEAEDVHVFYESDNAFVMPLTVSIASLIYHVTPNENLTVHILEAGITKENQKNMDSTLHKQFPNKKFKLDFIKFDEKLVSGIDSYKWPKFIYTRLFMARLLPPSAKRCVHIDADTVLVDNIRKVFDTPLDEKQVIAFSEAQTDIDLAAKDLSGFHIRNWGILPHQAQGGLVLLDLDKIRNLGLEEKWKRTLIENQKDKDMFTDEHLLMIMSAETKKILPPECNVVTERVDISSENLNNFSYHQYTKNGDKITKATFKHTSDPIMIHYAARFKPWNYYQKREEWAKIQAPFLYDLWYKYYEIAGFDGAPDKTKKKNLINSLVDSVSKLFNNLF